MFHCVQNDQDSGREVGRVSISSHLIAAAPLAVAHHCKAALSSSVFEPLTYFYSISRSFLYHTHSNGLVRVLDMTGKFSDIDRERCIFYAGFMADLSLTNANILFWLLFTFVVLLMCISSIQHHK
jgi:hypothetical protein